jgi:CBS domain-containing protein
MRIHEIMTRNPVTVQATAPVREAAALLRKHKIGGLPVMEEGKLVGIITESDILRLLETGKISDDLWLPSPLEVIEVPIREIINWEKTKHALADIGKLEVRNVMSHPAISIGEDEDIEDAAALLLSRKITRLPVLRDGTLVGIVARADIVRGVAGTG